jgi:hypothetical protein
MMLSIRGIGLRLLLAAMRDALVAERAAESDPRVRQELDILVTSRERAIGNRQVEHQLSLSPAVRHCGHR